MYGSLLPVTSLMGRSLASKTLTTNPSISGSYLKAKCNFPQYSNSTVAVESVDPALSFSDRYSSGWKKKENILNARRKITKWLSWKARAKSLLLKRKIHQKHIQVNREWARIVNKEQKFQIKHSKNLKIFQSKLKSSKPGNRNRYGKIETIMNALKTRIRIPWNEEKANNNSTNFKNGKKS